MAWCKSSVYLEVWLARSFLLRGFIQFGGKCRRWRDQLASETWWIHIEVSRSGWLIRGKMMVIDLEAISDGPAFDTDIKVSTAASNYNALWLWSIWSEIMTIGFGGFRYHDTDKVDMFKWDCLYSLSTRSWRCITEDIIKEVANYFWWMARDTVWSSEEIWSGSHIVVWWLKTRYTLWIFTHQELMWDRLGCWRIP